MAELKPLEAAVTSVTALPLRRLGRPVGRDDLVALAPCCVCVRANSWFCTARSGTGKSTVAATIANVYLQQHSRPVLWLTVRNPSLVELIVRVARAYGNIDIANAGKSAGRRNPASSPCWQTISRC